MAKLQGAKNSKINNPVNKMEKPNLVQAKKKIYPTSFRLNANDIASLKQITAKVNEEVNGKISETSIIKALIQLGINQPTAKIIKAYKDIL